MQLLYIARMNHETIPHHWINRLSFLTRKELTERFRAQGYVISPEEWAVLLLLWQRDGRTPGDMAQVTIRDRTTMTRLIDGMVRKDIVARRAGEEDRRQSFVFLTDHGSALQAALTPIAKVMIDDSLVGVSATEARQVVSVLARMTDNLMGKSS